MSLHASIVVPTCRRPALLDRCLVALAVQDFPPCAYEIVVADDAASPATREQVECWAARVGPHPAVRYLPVAGEAHGPAAARNRGWRAAAGAIIAFTDDDCVPEAGWLRAGVAALGCGGEGTTPAAGAWGRLVMPLPPVPTDYELNAAGLARAERVTANAFYRRDALAAVGGFDERFAAAWREDSDLFFSLLERGMRVVPAPDAVVVHPVRPAHWGVSVAQQRKSAYNALLYKKHPDLYRRCIQAAPPWRYYRAIGALAVAVGAALGRRRRLALLAAMAWSCTTGRFCAERLARTSRAPGHVAEMALTSALIPPLAVFWRLRGAVRYRVAFL